MPFIYLSMHICSLFLQLSIIQNKAQNTLFMEVTEYYSVISIPFFSKHLSLQMCITINHLFYLRPLASAKPSILDPHQDSSWLSCCCPLSERSYSFDSARLALSLVTGIDILGRFWSESTQSPESEPRGKVSW